MREGRKEGMASGKRIGKKKERGRKGRKERREGCGNLLLDEVS